MKTKRKKTMRKPLVATAIMALGMAMIGCISIPGQVTDRSKPVEQGKYTVVGDTVSSSVYNISIFGIIPLPPLFADSNDVGELADNIISSAQGRLLYHKALGKAAGADALIEYSMDHQYFLFPIVIVGRTTLSGTPVKTAQ